MSMQPATWLTGLTLAALTVLPFFVQGTYYRFLGIIVFIYGIVTVGLNILAGYAGQFSLGHAALMAMGAYTTEWSLDLPAIPVWASTEGCSPARVCASRPPATSPLPAT
jgi:branched-chain amino acid transport system permease protein